MAVVLLAALVLVLCGYIVLYDHETNNFIKAQKEYIKASDEYIEVLKENLDYYRKLAYSTPEEKETIDMKPVIQDGTIVYKMAES